MPLDMPEVTVKILTHEDDPQVPEGMYGAEVRAPSPMAETGFKYVAFLVESLEHLTQPEIRTRYVRHAAYALAAFEKPSDQQERQSAEGEYIGAIEPKLLEALADAA